MSLVDYGGDSSDEEGTSENQNGGTVILQQPTEGNFAQLVTACVFVSSTLTSS